MVEVDWSTLFKTFYEVVRIKVACKDPTKIPTERLFEMNKNLHVVGINSSQKMVMVVGMMEMTRRMMMMMRLMIWTMMMNLENQLRLN